MTLREWEAKQPVTVGTHAHGARFVPDAAHLVDRTEAFYLEDYAVSGVIGGTIWFVPRGQSLSMIEGGEQI